MEVKRICIVGGSLDGWMAASFIKKNLPHMDVVVIESKDQLEPISGASATHSIISFFHGLKVVGENDWMEECKATYKISNHYKNFKNTNDEGFFLSHIKSPLDGFEIRGFGELFSLSKSFPKHFSNNNILEILNPLILLNKKNKIPNGDFGGISWNPNRDITYHFDKNLLTKFLKDKVAMPSGVASLEGEVVDCEKDDDGNVINVITNKGIRVNSDLYIDCTGEKSSLLGQHMGVKFKSYDKYLINNKYLSIHIPYNNKKEQICNFTNNVAINNGWIQFIPLWDRIEVNYYYSDKFTTKEQAILEFKDYISNEFDYLVTSPKIQNYGELKQGMYNKSWVKNVVGIGKALGYTEPLLSTDILHPKESFIKILAILSLKDGKYNQLDRKRYNRELLDYITLTSYYTSLFYYASEREDSIYWKHNTQNLKIKSKHNNTTYDKFFLIPNLETFVDLINIEPDLVYISTGMGHSPINNIDFEFMVYKPKFKKNQKVLYENIKVRFQKIEKDLEKSLSSYEFLKDRIYKDGSNE